MRMYASFGGYGRSNTLDSRRARSPKSFPAPKFSSAVYDWVAHVFSSILSQGFHPGWYSQQANTCSAGYACTSRIWCSFQCTPGLPVMFTGCLSHVFKYKSFNYNIKVPFSSLSQVPTREIGCWNLTRW